MTLMFLESFFRLEAEDYLATLDAVAKAETLEIETVRRSARALRGVARLAGEPRMLRAADALEQALSTPPDSAPSVAALLLDSVPHFRVLVAAEGTASELDAHVDAVIERCHASHDHEADEAPAGDSDDESFRAFVGREADAIARTMDRGIDAFVDDPSDRDALGTILRRQRALLGSARLDEVSIVGETLRAVEDVSELIVRLDVPVKSEWLDVFRSARDVLHGSATCLDNNETPGPMPSLSRLRTIREELLDRYGDKEPAAPSRPLASRPELEIETVDGMRERANILRSDLLNAIGANARARSALEELYALAMRALH